MAWSTEGDEIMAHLFAWGLFALFCFALVFVYSMILKHTTDKAISNMEKITNDLIQSIKANQARNGESLPVKNPKK